MSEATDIVIFSPILNGHQSGVSDALWKLTHGGFRFVEIEMPSEDNFKGGNTDYSSCPYLIKAWRSKEEWEEAMRLALNARCCIFSSVNALPFQKARMKKGLLSFDMSERWLKRGWQNLFSPAIFRMFLAYRLGGWEKKPLYKLCCSGFAADDHRRLGMYRDKCFKWGYFTQVLSDSEAAGIETPRGGSTPDNYTPLMWCSRYLVLKHPELPILMADRLRRRGYRFTLNMHGEGELRPAAEKLARDLGLQDCVRFVGNKPNGELLDDMAAAEVFLFTSDSNEGWGAVANESMSQGCALVASEAIGSTPYLIQQGVTGFSFKAPERSSGFGKPDIDALTSLTQHVAWLLDHPAERQQMRAAAKSLITSRYSPAIAARRLVTLIDALQSGKSTPFTEGPCSPA